MNGMDKAREWWGLDSSSRGMSTCGPFHPPILSPKRYSYRFRQLSKITCWYLVR